MSSKPELQPHEFHYLHTKDIPGVPPDIEILNDWGRVTIVVGDNKKRVSGEHRHVRGTSEQFKGWIGDLTVWVGDGPPQFQKFYPSGIRDD